MKYIAILITALLPLTTIAQDKSDKKDKNNYEFMKDGMLLFTVNRVDCSAGGGDCHFEVLDKNGERTIRITPNSYRSKGEVSNANPNGNVSYHQYVFLKSERIGESSFNYFKPEKLAEFLDKQRFFVDGLLDEKAVDEFILINGTKHSDRMRSEAGR